MTESVSNQQFIIQKIYNLLTQADRRLYETRKPGSVSLLTTTNLNMTILTLHLVRQDGQD